MGPAGARGIAVRSKIVTLLAAVVLGISAPAWAAEEKVVHVYNWSDYIGKDTLAKFEQATGIKAVYDVYDSNETLEAKLMAGKSGYDVVFPSAHPFAQRQINVGLYRKLDKARLPNHRNLDPAILKALEEVDPGNQHVVPYMWGTTGIGINVDKVRKALGDQLPAKGWTLIFDPAVAQKLAACGISLLDDEQEGIGAALIYLGKDPNTTDPKDIEAAAAAFKKVRPYIRYFQNAQYINDLANGDLCVAQGYSGDILQARDRAEEAGNRVAIQYIIPKESALLWIDTIAIPADAPHPDNAHAFINFLLTPEVIAEISNEISYANANKASMPLLDDSIRNDPGIYPPEELKARFWLGKPIEEKFHRLRTRTWTRIKAGR